MAGSNGQVFGLGKLPSLRSRPSARPASPVVAMASTPDGYGYWLVLKNGTVLRDGRRPPVRFHDGKAPQLARLPAMAATPDGRGYWLVAADGGIFAFGDAHYYGSLGARPLNQPIVGIAATPDGRGYWLVASNGGIFAFGDAHFYGSMGARHLNQTIVAIAAYARRPGLLAGGGRWWHFCALEMPLLRLDGLQAAQPTDSGDGRHGLMGEDIGWRPPMAGCSGSATPHFSGHWAGRPGMSRSSPSPRNGFRPRRAHF